MEAILAALISPKPDLDDLYGLYAVFLEPSARFAASVIRLTEDERPEVSEEAEALAARLGWLPTLAEMYVEMDDYARCQARVLGVFTRDMPAAVTNVIKALYIGSLRVVDTVREELEDRGSWEDHMESVRLAALRPGGGLQIALARDEALRDLHGGESALAALREAEARASKGEELRAHEAPAPESSGEHSVRGVVAPGSFEALCDLCEADEDADRGGPIFQ